MKYPTAHLGSWFPWACLLVLGNCTPLTELTDFDGALGDSAIRDAALRDSAVADVGSGADVPSLPISPGPNAVALELTYAIESRTEAETCAMFDANWLELEGQVQAVPFREGREACPMTTRPWQLTWIRRQLPDGPFTLNGRLFPLAGGESVASLSGAGVIGRTRATHLRLNFDLDGVGNEPTVDDGPGSVSLGVRITIDGVADAQRCDELSIAAFHVLIGSEEEEPQSLALVACDLNAPMYIGFSRAQVGEGDYTINVESLPRVEPGDAIEVRREAVSVPATGRATLDIDF